ncbi:MAG: Clp protease N-terminal domain-containing protein [Actinomycetota bacterium]
METVGSGPYLRELLVAAEEEARRRGDGSLTPEHLVLALTRPERWPAELLSSFDLDPLDWRDGVNTVLGWHEGAAAEREGRPAGRLAESPADKRFEGIMAVASSVDVIVELTAEEAERNAEESGPAHVLVALILEANSVASASGRWFGLTPGRLRAAAGLRNERRVVADGIPPFRSPRPEGCGPVILCGGATDDDLLARIVALVRASSARRQPRVGLVGASWHLEPPTAEARRVEAERWTQAGADVLEVGLVKRADVASPPVTETLAGADLVWFSSGYGSALYDRLWGTPALEVVRHAHERGAAVGGVSAGAVVWGVGHLSDYASLGDEEPYPLFGWLHDVVVFPHWFASREARFRQTVRAFPGCSGLAIAHGGAVAVRAGGQIEVLRQGMAGATHATIRDADAHLDPVSIPTVQQA